MGAALLFTCIDWAYIMSPGPLPRPQTARGVGDKCLASLLQWPINICKDYGAWA